MAKFADLFPDDQLMQVLGDDITYQPSGGGSVVTKAIVDRDVERVGNDGYTVERRTEIELLGRDLPSYPKRGDRIAADGDHFTVEAVLLDDGDYIRLAVKK